MHVNLAPDIVHHIVVIIVQEHARGAMVPVMAIAEEIAEVVPVQEDVMAVMGGAMVLVGMVVKEHVFLPVLETALVLV